MNSTSTLTNAIALARTVHTRRTDKIGRPLLDCSLRVMRRLEGEHEQMTDVPHDVLENTTTTTADGLRMTRCREPAITAAHALTMQPGDPLDQAVSVNLITRASEYTDTSNNNDPDRLALLDLATWQRRRRKCETSIRLLADLTTPVLGTADGN